MLKAEQLAVQNSMSDKTNDLCQCPEVLFYHSFLAASSSLNPSDQFKTKHKVN